MHRDIKPENVMLRRDRLVKVLDFGLAKPTEPAVTPADSEVQIVIGITDGRMADGSDNEARRALGEQLP